ncbi:hypothetical protein ACFC96_07935 [Streptomyces sp. NPDC055955]|uniref:hypothetical protein n=1 Tax=Streptomyces sp. NPDC055955 TaxID=3345665 RepID=UPI0035E331EE
MWLRQVSGERRLRAAATRTAGALVATATALTALVAAAPAAADVVAPFAKRYDASLYGDFATIGNTVMGCQSAPADLAERCAAAAGGQGGDNNDTFVMQRVNTAATTAGYGSSTGRVTIPPGAKVAYARLFFGGNDGTYKGPSGAQLARCDISGADVRPSPGAPLAAVPVLGVNGGAPAKVSAEVLVRDPATADGPHYYTGEADVTGMFAGVTGTGAPVPVAVGGVWAPNGKGCVAGWSMTVVYEYGAPDPRYAPERRHVYVYGGHVLQRSVSPATTIGVDGFHRAGGGAVRAGVAAYEGDRNTPGDRFLVDGRNVTEAQTGDTDGFFVGEGDGAVAPRTVDSLGIDAKEFELPPGTVPPGATSTELTFTTEGDTYLPSALALSVPVPDLEVTGTASPKAAGPDGTLSEKPQPPAPPALRITSVPERPAVPPCGESGNTVTITDFSARKRTGAAVEWPVTAGSVPVASAGSVTKRGSVYVWKGDVAAHGKVVITQRVKAPCTAGGATVITVTADVPRTNCPKAPRVKADPCTSVITAGRAQARPAPPRESHRPRGSELADTGDSDTLLYGGLAGALCGLGVLAVAAARSRRD